MRHPAVRMRRARFRVLLTERGEGGTPRLPPSYEWWSRWKRANVGILTGERSGLAVLDVDPRNGGDLALEDLEQSYGSLPDTAVALSGSKGPHHYFALDGPLGKFRPWPRAEPASRWRTGSSSHEPAPLGNRYEWEASSHPADVALAPLPQLRSYGPWAGEAKASTPVQGVGVLPDTLTPVDIQALKVSHRIKSFIAMGHDPGRPCPVLLSEWHPEPQPCSFCGHPGLAQVCGA